MAKLRHPNESKNKDREELACFRYSRGSCPVADAMRTRLPAAKVPDVIEDIVKSRFEVLTEQCFRRIV